MGATNYFKCAGKVFFFDEQRHASIERAYADAQLWQLLREQESQDKVREPISVWTRLRVPGPWDACSLIGETSRLTDGVN